MTQEQFDSLPEAVQRRWRDEVTNHRAPSRDLIEITEFCLSGAELPTPPPGFSCRWVQ